MGSVANLDPKEVAALSNLLWLTLCSLREKASMLPLFFYNIAFKSFCFSDSHALVSIFFFKNEIYNSIQQGCGTIKLAFGLLSFEG